MATPVTFKEVNSVYGKDQPEYNPLQVFKDDDGTTISCWQFTPEELEAIKTNGGKCYLSILTFNGPLQPVKIMARIEDFIQLT